MPAIEFKAKAETVVGFDGTYKMLNVPKLKRQHCDMAYFRKHSKFGGIANSDIFDNALSRIARDIAPAGFLRTDKLPPNVQVDLSGFLAKVTIETV